MENNYRANFLWPHEEGSVEQDGYEFANAKTEGMQKAQWEEIIARINKLKQDNEDLRERMMDHASDYTPVMCCICGQVYNGQVAEDKPYPERTTCGGVDCISKIRG